ncbi:hypothetical protein M422DRAFT_264773 [Sphaerobolus stellatus SS14]|uniref:Unplaced genomic scaffold SPHSTscaffold_140, whole genome shotgun sequence n=1 Tax=Sphaerobolus stellatus (strain SS14) TaxID=990650 RepID=A0A0C9UEK0_SPHS4|nr:hypothetical protein M422DRAFT_264773 [Sphaerobolus stellatus SS14]
MAGPYGQQFVQSPNLPFQRPGLAALVKPKGFRTRGGSPPLKPSTPPPPITGDDNDNFGMDFKTIKHAYEIQSKNKQKEYNTKRHRERREAQNTRWQQEIIPSLICPYMMLREATKNGRIVVPEGGIAGGDLQPCSCGKKQRRLSYVAAYWAQRRISYDLLAAIQCHAEASQMEQPILCLIAMNPGMDSMTHSMDGSILNALDAGQDVSGHLADLSLVESGLEYFHWLAVYRQAGQMPGATAPQFSYWLNIM